MISVVKKSLVEMFFVDDNPIKFFVRKNRENGRFEVTAKTLANRKISKKDPAEFFDSIPVSKCDTYQEFAKINRKIVEDTGRSPPNHFVSIGDDVFLFYKGNAYDTPMHLDKDGNFLIDEFSKLYFARIQKPSEEIFDLFHKMRMKEVE